MAPYEPCERVPKGQTRRLLEDALAAAQNPRIEGESVLVDAYRRTDASRARYPNTGELLAAMVGRDCLIGAITEVNAEKHANLMDVWQNSLVKPVNASWRKAIAEGGAFRHSPKHPWVFSMDPMTYCEDGYNDDDKLYRADRELVRNLLLQYLSSDLPGIAMLFVYAVRPNDRPLFWAFADDLADDTGMMMNAFWLTHQGGNRNLAAVLSSGLELRTHWLPPGFTVGK